MKLLPSTRRSLFGLLFAMPLGAALALDNNSGFPNPTGTAATFGSQGVIDTTGPFFQNLGSNGRSCDTCHRPEQGWSLTPQGVKQRFDTSAGTDPLFRTNDGANSPKAKVATLAQRRSAYSMLINKAVIRIGLKLPAHAEFALVGVSDPYGYVRLAPDAELSLFRRPLPATNLKFLSAVMWDGRETQPGKSITVDLRNQANSATIGHAQGTPLSAAQRTEIVTFEKALFTAQITDKKALSLTAPKLKGGPEWLAKRSFYLGINDFTGDAKTGAAFNPQVFGLYDAWNPLIDSAPTDIRAAIARGQRLFNTRPLTISGVAGFNDSMDFGQPQVFIGTCSTCHNIPNVGGHSQARFMNIGTSDASRRTGDLPLYTLRHKDTGELVQTSDPGRALVTGLWSDVGRFKVPTLRGLAGRSPYFHNGMAKELGNVVDFYDSRFSMGLDNRERLDLILFLATL